MNYGCFQWGKYLGYLQSSNTFLNQPLEVQSPQAYARVNISIMRV